MSVQTMRVAAAAAAVLALSAAGYADDVDQANPDSKALLEYVKKLESRVNQLEQEKDWPLDQVRSESGSALENAVRSVNISGYMDFEYNLNLRHGGSSPTRGDTLGFNTGHGPANDENSFDFQNVQLLIDKPLTSANSTGFRVRAEYGNAAKFANRDPNFNADGGAFDLRETYLSWRMSGMGGSDHIDLSVGKFDSPLGFESLDNISNWQITRGPSQAFLLPVTHMGLRAAMPWSDTMKTTVYLVNGWDNVRDTGDGKTIIVSQEIGKFDFLNSSLTINGDYGHEGGVTTGFGTVPPDGDKTTFLEAIWRAEIDADTQFAVDGIWCRMANGRVSASPTTTPFGASVAARNVHAVEGYIRHQMDKTMWVSARTGYYADNGIGVGAGNTFRGYDLTLCIGWLLATDLTMELEARHDHCFTGDPFQNSSGRQIADQDVFTAAWIYRF